LREIASQNRTRLIFWPRISFAFLFLLEQEHLLTRTAAENGAMQSARIVVMAHNLPTTRPSACNYGMSLPGLRGDSGGLPTMWAACNTGSLISTETDSVDALVLVGIRPVVRVGASSRAHPEVGVFGHAAHPHLLPRALRRAMTAIYQLTLRQSYWVKPLCGLIEIAPPAIGLVAESSIIRPPGDTSSL
jgi:hypothetical protein